MNVFEAVKQSVTTRQAAEHYGIHVGRNGMACCPFHNDKTPSIERTQELSNSSFECSEDETSPLMQKYMEATTIVDTYHETKSSFAWIGEIEDERLLTALEHLKKEDLEIITLYAYEGYSVVELSKVYRIAHQNISKRIARITKFLKNFDFEGAK